MAGHMFDIRYGTLRQIVVIFVVKCYLDVQVRSWRIEIPSKHSVKRAWRQECTNPRTHVEGKYHKQRL